MPLEITAVVLCVIMLGALVVMMVIALAGVSDPPAFTHCRDCARWTIDTSHRRDPVCLRCRLGHGQHRRPHHVPVAHS
jgi:hypothetical protein